MFQIDTHFLLLRNSEPSSYPPDSCLLTSSAPFSLSPFFLPLSLDYLFLLFSFISLVVAGKGGRKNEDLFKFFFASHMKVGIAEASENGWL